MAITVGRLLMSKKTMRHHEMKPILGASHCDIQQTALFLELCRCTGAQIRRNATIDHVKHEH